MGVGVVVVVHGQRLPLVLNVQSVADVQQELEALAGRPEIRVLQDLRKGGSVCIYTYGCSEYWCFLAICTHTCYNIRLPVLGIRLDHDLHQVRGLRRHAQQPAQVVLIA